MFYVYWGWRLACYLNEGQESMKYDTNELGFPHSSYALTNTVLCWGEGGGESITGGAGTVIGHYRKEEGV